MHVYTEKEMQEPQASINELEKYTIAIKDRESGETHGTGVIVTDDGLILTCYHVIGDNENRTFYYKDTIDVYFPEAKITKPAKVIEEYCDSDSDIAFLKLNEEKEKFLVKQLLLH